MSTDVIRHGFSLGRVHVLEEQMLTSDDFERLLEARDLAHVIHILEETDYDVYVEKVRDETEIEDGLEKYLNYFYRFLDELQEPTISQFFRLPYDFDNLKALLLDSEHYRLSKLGTIEPVFLRKAIEEKNFSALSRIFKISEEVFESFAEIEPFQISRIVQKAMFDARAALARERGLSLMREIVELEIDLENIKTWLRKGNNIAEELLDGGQIGKDKYLSPLAYEIIADRCKSLAKVFAEDADVKDKDLQDCMVNLLKKYQYEPISANRLVAFIKAKELEVKNVKIVLLTSLNELTREMVEPNLGYLYV